MRPRLQVPTLEFRPWRCEKSSEKPWRSRAELSLLSACGNGRRDGDWKWRKRLSKQDLAWAPSGRAITCNDPLSYDRFSIKYHSYDRWLKPTTAVGEINETTSISSQQYLVITDCRHPRCKGNTYTCRPALVTLAGGQSHVYWITDITYLRYPTNDPPGGHHLLYST